MKMWLSNEKHWFVVAEQIGQFWIPRAMFENFRDGRAYILQNLLMLNDNKYALSDFKGAKAEIFQYGKQTICVDRSW